MHSGSSISCGSHQHARSTVRYSNGCTRLQRWPLSLVLALHADLLLLYGMLFVVCTVVRIGIWALIGVPSLRQIYSYLTDPKCKRLGHQCFMSIVILTTECLIVYKFGKGEFPAPMPDHVKVGCWIFAFLYALYCVGTIFKIHARQIEEREDEQTAVKSKAQ